MSQAILFEKALRTALREASFFRGLTSPNPPVGAAAVDREGRVIEVAAHLRAGEGHAEALLLRKLRDQKILSKMHAMVVTLEPCNHQGRTPPCTGAIAFAHKEIADLGGEFKTLFIGAKDPNPRVQGGGVEYLLKQGYTVEFAQGDLARESQALIAPFTKWITTGMPWVTVKQALDEQGSMIPAAGTKTFTSEDSLVFAHKLRKRADAILTGSGTVLADQPQLTVRKVPDFVGKRRWLAIADRQERVEPGYLREAESRGFKLAPLDLEIHKLLKFLGTQGCLEVLVEAGPTLTQSILQLGLWDEHVVIQKASPEDRITHVYRNC